MNFKDLIKPPYNLFVFVALVIGVISVLLTKEKFDFHLHDTYFVVSATYILWVVSFLLTCIWGIYKLASSILISNFLTWLHTLATIFVLIALFTSGFWIQDNYSPLPRKDSDYSIGSIFERNKITMIIIGLIDLVFLIGQLAFVINIVAGLARYLFANNKKEKLNTKH